MSALVDPSLAVQIVRAALLADSATTAIVGTRIRGEFAVDPDAGDPDYPSLVFAFSGGDGGSITRAGHYADLTYGMTVFSRTSASEALAGYMAAAAVLHVERLTLSGVSAVVIATQTSIPRIGWDEAHRAHYAVGRWRVQEIG